MIHCHYRVNGIRTWQLMQAQWAGEDGWLQQQGLWVPAWPAWIQRAESSADARGQSFAPLNGCAVHGIRNTQFKELCQIHTMISALSRNDTCLNMEEASRDCAKWNKPCMEEQTYHDSAHMRYLEQSYWDGKGQHGRSRRGRESEDWGREWRLCVPVGAYSFSLNQ